MDYIAHQAPPSMGFSRQEYWSGLPFPSPGESSWPRDRTQDSCVAGRRFNLWATKEASKLYHSSLITVYQYSNTPTLTFPTCLKKNPIVISLQPFSLPDTLNTLIHLFSMSPVLENWKHSVHADVWPHPLLHLDCHHLLEKKPHNYGGCISTKSVSS